MTLSVILLGESRLKLWLFFCPMQFSNVIEVRSCYWRFPVWDLSPGEYWPRLFCMILALFQRKVASCSVWKEGCSWSMDELPSSRTDLCVCCAFETTFTSLLNFVLGYSKLSCYLRNSVVSGTSILVPPIMFVNSNVSLIL
jgi:hypothetical protein